MTIFASHNTAVECWLSGKLDDILGGPSIQPMHRPVGIERIEPVATMLAFDRLCITYGEEVEFCSNASPDPVVFRPTAKEIAAARSKTLDFASSPLHVLVPDKNMAVRLKGVECHVHSTSLPSGSFLRISKDVLVCAPELCFAQVSTYLPFPLIVKLGIELCGLYARLPDGTARYWRVLPVTTKKALEAYLDRCRRLEGAPAARRALQYVAEGSGSPMETILTCLLCLPKRYGGYGLPLPMLNYRIERLRATTALDRRGYYLCDLYWPEAKLAVEYDSDQEHASIDGITTDAIKRNDLQAQGICPITVTKKQVTNVLELQNVAEQIAKRLDVRLRKDRLPSAADRSRLFHLLMYHH